MYNIWLDQIFFRTGQNWYRYILSLLMAITNYSLPVLEHQEYLYETITKIIKCSYILKILVETLRLGLNWHQLSTANISQGSSGKLLSLTFLTFYGKSGSVHHISYALPILSQWWYDFGCLQITVLYVIGTSIRPSYF